MCFTIPLYLMYFRSQDTFPILGRNGRLNQAWFPFWARNGVWVLRVSSERGPVVKMWGLPFGQSYLELALSILEARIWFPIYTSEFVCIRQYFIKNRNSRLILCWDDCQWNKSTREIQHHYVLSSVVFRCFRMNMDIAGYEGNFTYM